MATSDFIPSKEGDIVPWTENFITVANANLATLGLIASDITTITTKKTDYSTKLNASIAKQAEAKASTDTKNISKSSLVTNIRVLAKQIQAKPGVSNSIKELLGLTVPSPTPSPTNPVPPLNLTGSIVAGGNASIKWSRSNNPDRTTYLIELSNNYGSGWAIVGTSTKLTYELRLINAIGANFIRVRAQRNNITSDPSNVIIM